MKTTAALLLAAVQVSENKGDLEVLAKDLNPIELSANESKYNTTQIIPPNTTSG